MKTRPATGTEPAARRRLIPGLIVTGATLMVLVLLEAVLLRPEHQVLIGTGLVVASIGAAVLTWFARRGRTARAAAVVGAVGAAAGALGMIGGAYAFSVIAQASASVLALLAFSQAWGLRSREDVHGARRAFRVVLRTVAGVLAVAGALLSGAVVTHSITPAPLASAFRASLGFGNSFDPTGPESARTVLADGTVRTSDIRYGEEYPNSYLDVYIAQGDTTVARPTIVNVHGGGFIVGDKSGGDPAAHGGTDAGGDQLAVTVQPLLDAGYNFVSVDYGLAPDVTYPIPVIQVSQALAFLQEKGAAYGLDMENVVLTGASAGGQIVGQLAAIETNPAYAADTGIHPVMHDNLKALLLDSAVLDTSRVAQTQSPGVAQDFLFGFAARTYLGTTRATLEQASVIPHVTADFPPTFISDGNTGTFPDQARDLHTTLDSLGVTNRLNLYPKSEATLGHGFMASAGPQTSDYTAQKLAFLQTVLG